MLTAYIILLLRLELLYVALWLAQCFLDCNLNTAGSMSRRESQTICEATGSVPILCFAVRIAPPVSGNRLL